MKKKSAIFAIVTCIVMACFALFGSNAFKAPQPLAQLFPQGEGFEFEPPKPGSYTLNALKQAPNGAVLTGDGSKKELSSILSGKVSLVSFVYLMCGDENGCPLATSTLFDIFDTSLAAPILRNNMQLVTISFDPERDTVEAIDSFSYPILNGKDIDKKIKWHILTTENQSAIKPILKGFGQVVDRSKDGDQLNHLLRMFLVDRKGNIRNIYGLGLIDPRLLMTDIETLLLEDGTL